MHKSPGLLHKKTTGNLYFGFYAILFSILSIILILVKDYWGTPKMMFEALSKIRNIRKNKLFILVLIGCTTLYISCLTLNSNRYGYPQTGDEIVLPTYFMPKNKVIYLG